MKRKLPTQHVETFTFVYETTAGFRVCDLELTIDLGTLRTFLGRRAASNAGAVSRDGFAQCKRLSYPLPCDGPAKIIPHGNDVDQAAAAKEVGHGL